MTRQAVAAITLGVGVVLVLLGSLFPLYGLDTRVDGELAPGAVAPKYSFTAWEFVEEPDISAGDVLTTGPVYGYGLVGAALLVGVGAALQLRSQLQAAIGRLTSTAGFGLLVGTVWAAIETLEVLFGGPRPDGEDDGRFVGAGTWLLVVACAVVLVGVLIAHEWPARVPRPAGASVYQVEDDDTPPFGIAIPVTELDLPAPEVPDDDRRHPTG